MEARFKCKKVMVTIIWGVNRIYIVDFLPDGESYSGKYFVKHILNWLYEMKADIWGECDVTKKIGYPILCPFREIKFPCIVLQSL
jgi:hypothetical protein